MKPWAIVVIVVFAGLVAWALWYKSKQLKEFYDSGRMIKRNGKFWDDASVFTLSGAAYEVVKEKVEHFDLTKTSVKITEQPDKFFFIGRDFEAYLKKEEDQDGKNVWKYEVYKYDSKYGVPNDKDEMNVVLTAVEKMFLALDNSTTVNTIAIKQKTTTHL